MCTLRNAMLLTGALVPLTAGSCTEVCDCCPALHPVSVTAATSPHAASPDVTAEARILKRFTELSCSASAIGRPVGRHHLTMHSRRQRMTTVAEAPGGYPRLPGPLGSDGGGGDVGVAL